MYLYFSFINQYNNEIIAIYAHGEESFHGTNAAIAANNFKALF